MSFALSLPMGTAFGDRSAIRVSPLLGFVSFRIGRVGKNCLNRLFIEDGKHKILQSRHRADDQQQKRSDASLARPGKPCRRRSEISASSPEQRFGIRPTTVRYRWDRLFAANGLLPSLKPADLPFPLTDPTLIALCRLRRLRRSIAREITTSAVRYDFSSSWASSTGRFFPCWISSKLRCTFRFAGKFARNDDVVNGTRQSVLTSPLNRARKRWARTFTCVGGWRQSRFCCRDHVFALRCVRRRAGRWEFLLHNGNTDALRFTPHCGFLGASVPSDHLDTEISNSVIGCGEY